MQRTVMAAALLQLAVGPVQAATMPAIGGGYDGLMMIGFDPATSAVTGYFSSSTGAGQFSCAFWFKGVLRGRSAAIASSYPTMPDHIAGRLDFLPSGEVRVALPREHGGCWNVQHFADVADPAQFARSTPRAWRSVGVVRSAKAYFYDAPQEARRRRAYLVEGDGVGLPDAGPSGGWVRVEYLGEGRPVTGWLKGSDLYRLR